MRTCPVLVYHTVRDYGRVLPAGINMSPEKFSAQMQFLKTRNYNVVGLDKVVESFRCGKGLPAGSVAITFDDGYRDNYETAFPILREMKFPATVFLTGRFLDSEWREHGVSLEGLTGTMIQEMSGSGLIEFGGHGVSHRKLNTIDAVEAAEEVAESVRIVSDATGKTSRWYSYPFGSFNDDVVSAVKNAGCEAAFSVWCKKQTLFSLWRVPLHANDSLLKFRFKLSSAYFAAKKILRSPGL